MEEVVVVVVDLVVVVQERFQRSSTEPKAPMVENKPLWTWRF